MAGLKLASNHPPKPELFTRLTDYHAHLRAVARRTDYRAPESSVQLVSDDESRQKIRQVVGELKTEQLRYILVVGIGGSNLGTKAVYDAVFGAFDQLQPERFPKMLFAETTDPEWLTLAVEFLRDRDEHEVVVVLVSKSGTTTETIANFEILMRGHTFPTVVITDEGSALWQAATQKNWQTLPIPKMVGGRFSVFSAVGLLPLGLAGIDTTQLLAGACQARDASLGGEVGASGPAQSAALLYEHLQAGKTIYDTFLFHPELESLGKWYRQLMGESIGKEKNRRGETVHAGMTPTVSLGSTDLHSVGQLYLGGPRDKYTTFVSSRTGQKVAVGEHRLVPGLVAMVAGQPAEAIMGAILEGTQAAYANAGLPYNQLILAAIDPASIGAFLQFKMLEMMYLGELLNVNAFDQPNVENYKAVTREILEK